MVMRGLDVGATGILAHGANLQLISHNVANINTVGFQRSDGRFTDAFYEILKAPGAPAGIGASLGKGVQLGQTITDFRQGGSVLGQPLDVLISGPGFFRVKDDAGNIFYTRNGAFQPKTEFATGAVNLQLNGKSYVLDPPITLPGAPGALSVAEDGTITQGATVVGQLQLATFRNLDGLAHFESQLYRATPSSGPEIAGTPNTDGFGPTRSGFLESANVDISTELVEVLNAARNINLSSQAVVAGNRELLTVIELARRTVGS